MEFYIIIILLILLPLFAVISHKHKIKQQKRIQRQGLLNVSHIKNLISLTQVHRGLSSAWLNGDKSKKTALLNIEKKVNDEIKIIEKQIAIKDTSRWLSFSDHWGRLSKKSINNASDDSFKQHTQLIANLLYLLEDEAERCNLNASFLPELPSIGLVWRELVITAEHIGQSRAIGTGVAASQACSSVDKIRLSFLQKYIQKTASETLLKLHSIKNAKTKHERLITSGKTKINNYSMVIQQELIDACSISISHDEYFSQATDCMKALDDIFSLQLEQIQEII